MRARQLEVSECFWGFNNFLTFSMILFACSLEEVKKEGGGQIWEFD